MYIALSIAVLAIIALLVLFGNRKKQSKNFTALAGIAFACILVGSFFGENRLIGYSLIGVGVILAVVDICKKVRKKQYRQPSWKRKASS